MNFVEIAVSETKTGEGVPMGLKISDVIVVPELVDSSEAYINEETCIEHGDEVSVEDKIYGLWIGIITNRTYISI